MRPLHRLTKYPALTAACLAGGIAGFWLGNPRKASDPPAPADRHVREARAEDSKSDTRPGAAVAADPEAAARAMVERAVKSMDRDATLTWYNLNPVHFTNTLAGLERADRRLIISRLGSAIPDTAPALAIELADMDNANPGGSGFPENIYRRWLELDPEAGLENLLKAGPDDDAIKAIGRETSCQDPLTLARLAMRCPALLDDEGFQLQVLVPVIEAVASNDEAGLAEEPGLKGFLMAAEMVVHPEALVENWSADSGAFGQLDPERLARLSLAVGPDNFRAMVNGMPTMELRQKIVSMGLERFSGFPEQLLMFHRSIEDADLASQSKERFREAIEAWSPSLADQLMNPREHSP